MLASKKRTSYQWRIRNTKKFFRDNSEEFRAIGFAVLAILTLYGLIIIMYGLGLWSY